MNIESNVKSDVVFRHIIVPHDLTSHADAALHLAATMARPQLSMVVVVNVVDPNEDHENEDIHSVSQVGDLARNRWKLLKFAARRILPPDVKVDVRILSGEPQNALLAEAHEFGADLLIISNHPLTGTGYPFGGCALEQIKSRFPCPVLTVSVSGENGASIGLPKLRELETHSLEQYCALSRRLAKEGTHRPAFIGYSHLPSSPSGVCD